MSTTMTLHGSVEDTIAEMKRATGAVSDAELARMLDLQRSAIAQWKKRGSVPAKALRKVDQIAFALEREGQAAAWLEDVPQDIRSYARALAVSYMAPPTLDLASTEARRNVALRLHRDAQYFDEVVVACALKIDQLMQMQPRLTMRGAYTSLLFDPYFKSDVSEKVAHGELAFLRRGGR